MSQPDEANAALILDFLTWLAAGPRAYAEVMEAWRTSCPRLTIWEDSLDAGLVARRRDESGETLVALTDTGRAWLGAGVTPGARRASADGRR